MISLLAMPPHLPNSQDGRKTTQVVLVIKTAATVKVVASKQNWLPIGFITQENRKRFLPHLWFSAKRMQRLHNSQQERKV